MFEIGRVCVKTAGREAGKHCVVVKKINDKTVLVTGPRAVTHVRRRNCSITHLEPLFEKIDIKENADENTVLSAFDKAKLYEKLGLSKPTADQIKAAEDAAKRGAVKTPTQKKAQDSKAKKKDDKKAKPKEEKKAEPKKEVATIQKKEEKPAPQEVKKEEPKAEEKK